MNVQETRKQHPLFTYRAFEIKPLRDSFEITYRFSVSPDIEFAPKLTIPYRDSLPTPSIDVLAFNLGLIEAVSYWKATCSPELVVEAGSLTDEQIAWWHDLFIHGLGEFFYKNGIDFTAADFLSVRTGKGSPVFTRVTVPKANGDLALVGGGKDSAVTLNLISGISNRQNVLLLNPTPAMQNVSRIAGYDSPIVVIRTIDPKLLTLNAKGYLNGHTPFSAYLSFLGVTTAVLSGYRQVVVANESSAGEGSVVFHNMDINHQYSKSLRYEKLFREYCRKFLTKDVSYFSFLRPLTEVQTAALFSGTQKFDTAFNSCNVTKNKFWCGTCPKCAFVYLMLAPFMDAERMKTIFGPIDYFESPEIQRHIIDLTGLGEHKPFDCVGTEDESRSALRLALHAYQKSNRHVPDFLKDTETMLTRRTSKTVRQLHQEIREYWSSSHFLPPVYEDRLRRALSEVSV